MSYLLRFSTWIKRKLTGESEKIKNGGIDKAEWKEEDETAPANDPLRSWT